MKKGILIVCILVIALGLCFSGADAYYGMYGGLMGMYGGLMGMYGGLMGMYGGMMGMYGGMMGMYGGMMGMYGGMMGMYGGMYGSLYSPFSFRNLYYPVQTAGGLTYQVPFLQVAPLLGIAGLYNQLFPNLFNPQAVSIPTTFGITFPTPVLTQALT